MICPNFWNHDQILELEAGRHSVNDHANLFIRLRKFALQILRNTLMLFNFFDHIQSHC
jgi:hypothetical protein